MRHEGRWCAADFWMSDATTTVQLQLPQVCLALSRDGARDGRRDRFLGALIGLSQSRREKESGEDHQPHGAHEVPVEDAHRHMQVTLDAESTERRADDQAGQDEQADGHMGDLPKGGPA